MTLNDIALKYNTDKSNKFHNYTKRYEAYFESLKDKPIRILEIGIQNGYSLKTWKEYFSKAQIYGVDIVDCSHMNQDRIITLTGSQNDCTFLKYIVDTYGPFDIIIDDGSHYSTDIKISFDFLFPTLAVGGLYVVEDLHCSYWTEFSDGGRVFMRRIKKLFDSINGNGKWGLADIDNESKDTVYQKHQNGSWWERNVEYIHLYRSIVFIKKYNSGSIGSPKLPSSIEIFYAHVWRLTTGAVRRLRRKLKSSYENR